MVQRRPRASACVSPPPAHAKSSRPRSRQRGLMRALMNARHAKPHHTPPSGSAHRKPLLLYAMRKGCGQRAPTYLPTTQPTCLPPCQDNEVTVFKKSYGAGAVFHYSNTPALERCETRSPAPPTVAVSFRLSEFLRRCIPSTRSRRRRPQDRTAAGCWPAKPPPPQAPPPGAAGAAPHPGPAGSWALNPRRSAGRRRLRGQASNKQQVMGGRGRRAPTHAGATCESIVWPSSSCTPDPARTNRTDSVALGAERNALPSNTASADVNPAPLKLTAAAAVAAATAAAAVVCRFTAHL